jgi:hypothetical protein
MSIPKVKEVNKGKRRLKKHKYKLWDMVAFKWIAEREIGFISELKTNREGFATYTIRSVSRQGNIYSDMEVDDPTDPYSYISTILTKSITDGERTLVQQRTTAHRQRIGDLPKPQPNGIPNVDVDELDKAIKKQKAFVNGEKFW